MIYLFILDFASAEWKVLKNRKFLGTLGEQNIRTKSRPVIQELQTGYVSISPPELWNSAVHAELHSPPGSISDQCCPCLACKFRSNKEIAISQ